MDESNQTLEIELDNNIHLKKQHSELQKTYAHLERAHSQSHDKYQELITTKVRLEKDYFTLQTCIEQEKNAKFTALEKIQDLEGRIKIL